MKCNCILVVLCAVAIYAGAPAQAGDTRYQDFVVGGRAIGLGGAFVSIANDSSGVYYNPAGLADVRQSSVSVTTSLYGFEQGASRADSSLPVAGLDELDVDFSELVVIPATAGFVQTFGEKGADGDPVQAYGMSVVVPSFRTFSTSSPRLGLDLSDDGRFDDTHTSYHRRVTDRQLWAGFGYGRKLTPRLRLGASAFYVMRSAVDVEEVASAATLRQSDEQVFRIASNEVNYLNGNLVFVLGAKYLLTKRLSVGVAVRPPSVQLHSQARLRFSRGISVPACDVTAGQCADAELLADGPRSQFEYLAFDDVSSQTRYSTSVRFGASYAKPYKFTVSVDGTYHAPVSYELIAVDPQVRQRLPFNPLIERRQVINLNAGGEFLVIRQVSVAGGVFTNFSSAPHIPAHPQADQPAQVDMLGLTMALGYFGTHSISRLGVVYSFGSGRDVVPENSIDRLLEDRQGFRRIDATQSFFYVFLSSSFRY